MIKHHSKEHNKKISDTCKLRHINVKHGLSMIQHYCKDCKRKITWRALQCASCFAKERFSNPKNHPSYIDGRCTKLHYCIDCKKQSISLTGWRGQGRCAKCSRVYNMKTMMQKGSKYYKGFLMKSSWEVAYAKWLDKQDIKWEYELKTFDLGNTTYTPDFYLPKKNTYIEIKGWFRKDAKQKMIRFHKLFPDVKVIIITDFLPIKIRSRAMFPFSCCYSISTIKP